jgi:hypothetical protein
MATANDQIVRTITLPLTQGSDTANTVHYTEAGVDAKRSSVLFWVTKDALAPLSAHRLENLTITLTATKSEPGTTVDAPEPKPTSRRRHAAKEADA